VATQTLYGSSIADATLTTADDMATTTGGTETSKTTTTSGTNTYSEVFSQGGSSTGASSIPATPTGKGWVYNKPGAGTYATGNWSASVTFSGSSLGTSDLTIRFFRYSSGTYTQIGTINKTGVVSAKTTYSFPATSMGTITFAANDLLYVDLWFHDTSTIGGDNPVIYVSNSATQGVANDMVVTTSNFTPSGGGPTHRIICDGMGGMFV